MQTPITPTFYGPLGLANLLTIRGVGPINDSGCQNYFYDIQRVTETTPAVAAVPATKTAPAIPAVAATYTTVSITNGNEAMTAAQWANWADEIPNEDYQLDCIAANLGLTRA